VTAYSEAKTSGSTPATLASKTVRRLNIVVGSARGQRG
jgi:hypothetical protein